MLEGPIAVKDLLWWAPHDPRAFERVVVTGIAERKEDGELMVKTINMRTHVEFWNRELRVRQLCTREPKRQYHAKGVE